MRNSEFMTRMYGRKIRTSSQVFFIQMKKSDIIILQILILESGVLKAINISKNFN